MVVWALHLWAFGMRSMYISVQLLQNSRILVERGLTRAYQIHLSVVCANINTLMFTEQSRKNQYGTCSRASQIYVGSCPLVGQLRAGCFWSGRTEKCTCCSYTRPTYFDKKAVISASELLSLVLRPVSVGALKARHC